MRGRATCEADADADRLRLVVLDLVEAAEVIGAVVFFPPESLPLLLTAAARPIRADRRLAGGDWRQQR